MLPVQFVYTENGERKSSLDEHRRRNEILELNRRLSEQYPVFKEKKMVKENKDL